MEPLAPLAQAAEDSKPLPDYIAGVPRYVSIGELAAIFGVSRDTIYRRAGTSLPPLHSITEGKKGALITDVRAKQRGETPWLKK